MRVRELLEVHEPDVRVKRKGTDSWVIKTEGDSGRYELKIKKLGDNKWETSDNYDGDHGECDDAGLEAMLGTLNLSIKDL